MAKAAGRRTVSRAEYRAYIQGPEWQAVRQRFRASKLPKECYACGAGWRPGFHLHHRTYKNLGAERLMDLVSLCPRCHAACHTRQRESPGLDLWKATKLTRRDAPRV